MRGDQQAETTGGLTVHALFVGSRDGKAFPDADKQAVIEATTAAFAASRSWTPMATSRAAASPPSSSSSAPTTRRPSSRWRGGSVPCWPSNPSAMKPGDVFTQLRRTDPPYGSVRIYSNLRPRHHAEAAK